MRNSLSVVPATTWIGEVTLAPAAGVQIVTEGDALFSVHCAKAGAASRASSRAARAKVRFVIGAQGPEGELGEQRRSVRLPIIGESRVARSRWKRAAQPELSHNLCTTRRQLPATPGNQQR